MKNNDIIKFQDTIYRIIGIKGDKAFVVDCNKKVVPKWIDIAQLSSYCPDKLENYLDEELTIAPLDEGVKSMNLVLDEIASVGGAQLK